jgi:signal transduction histidine kinase
MEMISVVKKRLVVIFTSVIIGVNILFMAVILLYIHLSLLGVCKKHIREDIEHEFIPNYQQGGTAKLAQIYDEDYLQVLNSKGEIIGGTINSYKFKTVADAELLRKAFAGELSYKTLEVKPDHYLVAYFPLDKNAVGRIAMTLNKTIEFEHNFLKMILFSFPGMLLLSFFLSNFLVRHALKPAMTVCDFQENYLSNITHELRSPLASLRGNLEVSLRKDRPVEEYREVIQLSLKETDRVIDLLKNLHLLSSSKLKPLKLTKDYTDLKMIVSELVSAYMPQMQSKGITLHVGQLSDCICTCDESLIKRAIENILDNAVKYTPEGGLIRVNASRDQQNVYLNITNTCRDMHENEIKNLFEPFYRGKSLFQKNIEGQGLGLSIARHIVQTHKGDLRLNITEDNEFSVTISLPQ